MTYRNKKLRESAQGKDCQLRIPGVCNGNPETVVWCHLNGQEYGKGMGHKAHDLFGFYGCSACHDVYDGRARIPIPIDHREWTEGWRGVKAEGKAAMLRSLLIACDEGAI
jgi:hypothetical protein